MKRMISILVILLMVLLVISCVYTREDAKRYQQEMKIFDEYAMSYFDRGLDYYYERKYDQAIEQFNTVIRMNSGYTEAYFNRGLAYYAKKKYDLAIADFERVLRTNPGDGGAKNALEKAYEATGY